MLAEMKTIQALIEEIARGLLAKWDEACHRPTGEFWSDGKPVMGMIPQCKVGAPDRLNIAILQQEFGAFANEWDAFVRAHDDWYDRMWGATYDSIADFKRRAIEWKALVKGAGVPLPAPTTAVPEGFPWKKIMTLSLVLGGTYLAVKVIPRLVGR